MDTETVFFIYLIVGGVCGYHVVYSMYVLVHIVYKRSKVSIEQGNNRSA